MTSIRKAKKLGIYKTKKLDKVLYQNVKKQVEEVNKRLTRLKKSDEYGSWASKKLFNRLDTKNLDVLERQRTGQKQVQRIKLTKNLTNTDLRAIEKATNQFLQSKTSTSRGIKITKNKTIESIRKTLSLEQGRKVTEEDAEYYYDMLANKDFDWFNDKIGASAMWSLIEDAIEHNDSESDWIKRIENHAMTMNDVDARERALRLYEKYIS